MILAAGLLAWVVVVAGVVSPTLHGQVRVEAVLGFDGALVAHHPNPLTLIVHNQGAEAVELDVTVLRSVIGEERILTRNITVSGGVGRALTFLVPGDVQFVGALELRSSGPALAFEGTINGKKAEGTGKARVWRMGLEASGAVVGSSGGTTVRAVALGGRGRQIAGAVPATINDRTLNRQQLHWADLAGEVASLAEAFAPDTWLAWSGVDTVMWTEPDPAQMPDPAQLRALLEYVEFGGRLVIISAHRPERLAAPELASLLPAARFDVDPEAPGAAVLRPVAPRPYSQTHLFGASRTSLALDLALECPLGAGSIVVALFDPLREDTGDPGRFLAALSAATGRRVGYRHDSQANRKDPRSYGASEFRKVLLNNNVVRPPIGLYVLLGCLFLLLIGPIDLRFLRRRGKLRWSPVTLLIYTLLFTAISLVATLVLFGGSREINRIAVLDFTEGADGASHVNGWVFLGIYAPTGGQFDLHVPGFDAYGMLVVDRHRDWRMMWEDEPTHPQRYVGPGSQPLDLELGVNSFRQTATRLAGPASATLDATLEDALEGWTLRLRNGLGVTITSLRGISRDANITLPDLPPGGEVVIPVKRSRGRIALSPDSNPPKSTPWILRVLAKGPPAGSQRWRLEEQTLDPRTLMIVGVIPSLPFPDDLSDERSSLSEVVVRRRIHFPFAE